MHFKLLIYERTEKPDGHLLFTSILLSFPPFPPFPPFTDRTTLGRCDLLTSGGGGVTGLEVRGDVARAIHVAAAVAGTAAVGMGLIDSSLGAQELGLVLGIDTGVGAVIVEVAEENMKGGSKDGTSQRSEGGRREAHMKYVRVSAMLNVKFHV